MRQSENIKAVDQVVTPEYAIYQGDSCELIRGIPGDSVHFGIHSPPFEGLYKFSNFDRDISNNEGSRFWEHYAFLIQELLRVTMPGRLHSVHVMQLPMSKIRHGHIGMRDFRGEVVRRSLRKTPRPSNCPARFWPVPYRAWPLPLPAKSRSTSAAVRMHVAGGKLIFAATDSYHLARVSLDCPSEAGAMPGVTLRTEAANAMGRFAAVVETVKLSVSNRRIELQAGQTRFITKLIEETYPDYERIVPSMSGRAHLVDRNRALEAVTRLGSIGDADNLVILRPGPDGIILTSRSGTVGDAVEHVDAQQTGGEPMMAAALGRRRLMAILSAFEGEFVTIDQGAELKPIRIVGSDSSDVSFDSVLMPQRVRIPEFEDGQDLSARAAA